jgi:myosin heavy subunit
MPYPDFKLRYSCLGQAAIKSSEDTKTAVWALMDGVPFNRDWYRLGHTMVFFRAGSLGRLEEARDQLTNVWVRKFQGEVLKRVRGKVYHKKFDQRELIKVAQRQFRKYMGLRDWGWFRIIQQTRPMIGRPDPNEELKQLEEKANATYGVYKEKVDLKVKLLAENEIIVEEKKALMEEIAKSQGDMGQYHARQAKATEAKADFEIKLVEAQNKLKATENARLQATNDKKSLELESVAVKKDIADIEMTITKLEQEKNSRDHAIKGLNDEIANQDEVINKLNKEKKHVSESSAKSAEDLQAASDKVDHLNKVQQKLESTMDELESSVEKEKRARTVVEKDRRRVEGELKMAQETVADIERSKKELEASIMRKDGEIHSLASRLDDEQSLVGKVQKNIKELQGRIEEMEEELEAERQARAKAERQRSDLAREMDSLGDRLNEAGGATHAQMELNKKRESEVIKLRKDLEESNIQHEATLTSLKKKQADSIAEMSEQMDQLSKMKAK